jgi:hypothetical protein
MKGIRSFLGHAGFYRGFIKSFYKVARVLINHLQKDAHFNFDESCFTSFTTLKQALLNAPIIKPTNWRKSFDLFCEASNEVVGAVLCHNNGDELNIVHHSSRTLNEAQRRYPIAEKELVAVVFSFDKFRSYIIESEVRVHNDCDILKEILERTDVKPRMIRWTSPLQKFEV